MSFFWGKKRDREDLRPPFPSLTKCLAVFVIGILFIYIYLCVWQSKAVSHFLSLYLNPYDHVQRVFFFSVKCVFIVYSPAALKYEECDKPISSWDCIYRERGKQTYAQYKSKRNYYSVLLLLLYHREGKKTHHELLMFRACYTRTTYSELFITRYNVLFFSLKVTTTTTIQCDTFV